MPEPKYSNERLKQLVAQEDKAWKTTIDALGGPGRVPIRFLINTECKKKGK